LSTRSEASDHLALFTSSQRASTLREPSARARARGWHRRACRKRGDLFGRRVGGLVADAIDEHREPLLAREHELDAAAGAEREVRAAITGRLDIDEGRRRAYRRRRTAA